MDFEKYDIMTEDIDNLRTELHEINTMIDMLNTHACDDTGNWLPVKLLVVGQARQGTIELLGKDSTTRADFTGILEKVYQARKCILDDKVRELNKITAED